MRGVLEVLPFVVVGVAVVVCLLQVLNNPNAYERMGRGGLSLDDGAPAAGAAAGERDAEIRQMLAARNARRARQGRPPLDVEAELRRLTAAAAPAADDPQLEREVRELVLARNARRARRGQPPLDVEAEVRRQLRER